VGIFLWITSLPGQLLLLRLRLHFLVPREEWLSLCLRPVVTVFLEFSVNIVFYCHECAKAISYDHSTFTCQLGNVYRFYNCFLCSTVDRYWGFSPLTFGAPNFFVFFGAALVDFYIFVVFFFQFLCCFCAESDVTWSLWDCA
jgi:hypothetical protein